MFAYRYTKLYHSKNEEKCYTTTRVSRKNHGRTCRLRSVHQRNVLVRLQHNQDEQPQLRHQGISSTTLQNRVCKCRTGTTHSYS